MVTVDLNQTTVQFISIHKTCHKANYMTHFAVAATILNECTALRLITAMVNWVVCCEVTRFAVDATSLSELNEERSDKIRPDETRGDEMR